MEHRAAPRDFHRKEVSLYVSGVLRSNTYAENYSDQGMYIRANGVMYPKESQLEIRWYDKKNKITKIIAKVVHRNLSGIGVRFLRKLYEKEAC